MTFVNKLEIQGIRSVGPNSENAVKIKFFRPFTLITGENGAGKTTIIEALKYATSGVMPPGAAVKGGWLHHPKLEPPKEQRVYALFDLHVQSSSESNVSRVRVLF